MQLTVQQAFLVANAADSETMFSNADAFAAGWSSGCGGCGCGGGCG